MQSLSCWPDTKLIWIHDDKFDTLIVLILIWNNLVEIRLNVPDIREWKISGSNNIYRYMEKPYHIRLLISLYEESEFYQYTL